MINKNVLLSILTILILTVNTLQAQRGKHSFEARNQEFLLDKKPFQLIGGELDPSRIPMEYWLHRIRMAKAMGINTITANVFWNYYEIREGEFDFTAENRDLSKFIKTINDEKLWLILKTGPYTGTGWEDGGIPSYLLKNPDIKLRSTDAVFSAAAKRYITALAGIIKPFLATNGGPVLMLQTEDGNDTGYISWLKKTWDDNDIDVPVLTGKESIPDIPLFAAGHHDRCLHWGEKPEKADTAAFLNEVRSLMKSGKSFNLFVHGGTNFGFMSGACSGENGYEPDLVTYDLAAPINEQGLPAPLYTALRTLFESYMPKGKKLEAIPEPIPVFEIPALSMGPFTSVWDNLPQPVKSENPKTFEEAGQDYGLILYRTVLTGHEPGKLVAEGVHDYATVFLDGQYIGSLERREGINEIDIPQSSSDAPILELLVEAMGRIAPGNGVADRKGLTGKVTLNGSELKNWNIYNLPLDWKFIYGIRSTGKNLKKPGIFFKGNFSLIDKADTYFDVSNYTKGMIWINGHNLGRFWNIGPQRRLYCPSSWIKKGMNEIIIFDMVQTEARPFSSFSTSE